MEINGKPFGELWICHSFEMAAQAIWQVRRYFLWIWLAGLAACLAITFVLVRRILRPVRELERAAKEVARQNCHANVSVKTNNKLGDLAESFNAMCLALQKARENLIRQEQISTIGRLSSALVHDLRNPLASIYGGAEMLVDGHLDGPQLKRLGSNMYYSARQMVELLTDLVEVSRGKSAQPETCFLKNIVEAGCGPHRPAAESQSVSIQVEVPGGIELELERFRMERVFSNLIGNSLEVMPQGGTVRISAWLENGMALVSVEDTGPGIPEEIRGQLFQPFVTSGKRQGLGLGLALSRQTVLDHQGDMWLDSAAGSGARILVKLPLREAAMENGSLAAQGVGAGI